MAAGGEGGRSIPGPGVKGIRYALSGRATPSVKFGAFDLERKLSGLHLSRTLTKFKKSGRDEYASLVFKRYITGVTIKQGGLRIDRGSCARKFIIIHQNKGRGLLLDLRPLFAYFGAGITRQTGMLRVLLKIRHR